MRKFPIPLLSVIIDIRNLHLSWLRYACCTIVALSSCFWGKAQMNFPSGLAPDFSAYTPFLGTEQGFVMTDNNISNNLSKGFEFRVTINTNLLAENVFYNVFAIGYFQPDATNPKIGQFCTVIRLALQNEQLFFFRSLDQATNIVALPLWNAFLFPFNKGVRTIKFNIDSFSTKIYCYDPGVAYANDQTCELLFWGLLGSQAKRIFENPCWPGAFPAVLLPINEPEFLTARLDPYSHISISPASSHPVTGGSNANPQTRVAGQGETCSCPADSLSPGKMKNITRQTLDMPTIPMYLNTTSVAAENEKKPAAISSLEWSIYPNPTADKITLEINSPGNQEAAIELTDQQGRRVYTGTISIAKGVNQQTISLKKLHLSAGMYFIRLRPTVSGVIPEKEQTRKIILQ